MGAQEKAFRQGVDVIVATPGRLLDHFQYGYAKLSGLEYLVLDEADRMLDMGFLPDIKRVLKHVPKPKQTFFFSATMPPPIETLTRDLLRNPAKIALQRRAAPAEGGGTDRLPRAGEPQEGASGRALLQEPHGRRVGLHAYEAPREPVGEGAEPSRYHRGAYPRKPLVGAAHQGSGGLQGRQVPRSRRDGHRCPRHRRRSAGSRGELRYPGRARGLHPPSGTHRPRRVDRRGLHAGVARRGRVSWTHRADGRDQDQTGPPGGLLLPGWPRHRRPCLGRSPERQRQWQPQRQRHREWEPRRQRQPRPQRQRKWRGGWTDA